ncbi:TonB-dependent hemoglobin/transferrin/lactoferrin family receptor [Methylomonas koyamae]|uniref:TonB-dependent hemoglobin/transferrin/lactoferrin family receptor n=1 Tax=Methylomonas koyamae TaxID=702114 RepID=UPI0009EE0FC8|nr:TonB-dependent hemoglobin/transferrin/lactoferrin family receptor [Methylomonas koyamae]
MATKPFYLSIAPQCCPDAACSGQPGTCRRALFCVLLCCLAGTALAADPEVVEMPEDLELETVTVKAQADKPAAAPPGTQSTIDEKTIEQRMVRDIKDLIRYEPGVNVGSDPQRFGSTGFTIRGLGGNRVLMQIDGVRLPDSFSIGSFANSTRNAVDMDALKQVDIVRGAGPAAYGGDALGGTVNFVTKDPQDYLQVFGHDYYTGLKLHYNTTDNNFTQTATAAGVLGGWEGLAVFSHSHSNETDNRGGLNTLNGTRTLPSPQDNQGYNLLAKLLYRFSDANLLRVTGEWMHKASDFDALYARDLDISGRFVNSMLTDDSQLRWRLSLDHTLKGLDAPLFDQAYWQFYTQQSATRQITNQDRRSNANGRVLVERIFDFDNRDFGGQLRLDKHFGFAGSEHDLQYGGQISKNSVAQLRDGTLTCLTGKLTAPIGGPTPECRQGLGTVTKEILPDEFPVRDFPLSTVTKAGAYLQDNIALFDRRIELVPGGRWEYYRLLPQSDYLFEKAAAEIVPAMKDANAFLPKFGALLHLTDRLTLHGQYAHGFRGPNFSDSNLGFTNAAFRYASVPNLALQPETSVGAEVGLRGQGDAGQFDLTLFRNDYDRFMYDATVCDPLASGDCEYLTFQTVNSPDPIRMQGIEIKGRFFLDWAWPQLAGASLMWSGSYTAGLNLRSGRTDDVALRKISPMKGVLGLRYDQPSGDWGSELILTLVGPKQQNTAPAEAIYLTSGYGVVDFNAYYNVNRHVSLNLGVFNVFDSRYIDWEDVDTQESNPHRNLGPFANADIRDRYSRPGRNLGVTLKIAY